MPYALSNIGQGATAYGTLTAWTRPASGDWWVRIKFSVNDTSSNQQLAGRSNSTVGSLRVVSGGILRLRDNGTDLISSASGAIVAETIYDAKFGRSGNNFFLDLDTISVGTATYTASTITNPLNQLMRFSTSAYGVGVIYEFETNGGTYDALLNGSNAPSTGTTWTDGVATITATNFTGAADSWWLFYSTGSSFAGDIIKSSLSLSPKPQSIVVGSNLSVVKNSLTTTGKSLSASLGFNAASIKQTLPLSSKQFSLSAGSVLQAAKVSLVLNSKTLTLTAGANIAFSGDVGKSTLIITPRAIGLSTGFNSSLTKLTTPLNGKTLDTSTGFSSSLSHNNLTLLSKGQGVNGGYLAGLQEQHLVLANKNITLTTGTEVAFLGEITKSNLSLVGKSLSLVSGTSVPFEGSIIKTSLVLTGKVLSSIQGQVLNIQKKSLNLVSKQLIFGLPVNPVIPISRLFLIEEKGRTYLMKQTTNVFVMTQRNNTFIIK